MSGETVITIVGNLTADPELRWTQSGSPVASFTIASTPRSFDRQSGEWKDGETLFMRCTAWREMAENIAESLRKGSRTMVRGRLVQRSFETREGDRRTVVELQADEVGVSLRHARAQVTRTGGQGQPAAASGFASTPVGQESSTGSDPWAEAMLPSDPPF
nr:MAG TPA: Single stranded DNA binding protein [Caudoviricetes sp.]